MHETYLLKNIFRYLEEEQIKSNRKIKKIYVLLSEFGGISPEHFKEHFKEESRGGKWAALDLDVKKVPFGLEIEITRLDFE